jgi:hypothetical protein
MVQYHVFLAHSWGMDAEGRDNHKRAAELYRKLIAAGFKVWFDNDQVGPSKYFNIKPFPRAVRFESCCTPSPRVCTRRPWFGDWFSQTVHTF